MLFNVRVLTEPEDHDGTTRWYQIRMVCRLRPSMSWTVRRRFSHFTVLSRELSKSCLDCVIPSLPPKLTLWTSMEQQRRTSGLQRFCEAVLLNPIILADPVVGQVGLVL